MHICDLVIYANFIKPNIVLFEMFSNIAKHQIALTEPNKNKKRKIKEIKNDNGHF